MPALEWAAEQNMIMGIDGDFCPDQTINRETMAVMIRRAASVLSISSPSDWKYISIDYTDLSEVSDWAVDGIAFCAVYEIMSGNPDGSFAPKRELTRAEAAAVLQRVDGLRQKAAAPDEGDGGGAEERDGKNFWKRNMCKREKQRLNRFFSPRLFSYIYLCVRDFVPCGLFSAAKIRRSAICTPGCFVNSGPRA